MSKDHSTDDVAFIKALAELLNDNELSEISVKREYGENDTLNVKVSKMSAMAAAPAPVYAPAPQAPAASAPAAAAPAAASKSSDPADHPGAVASPMVGTAYLAPEPGADAFVSVGQQVSAGQTLLIIEAMKTMNPVPAPKAGKVVAVLIENEQPVEYEQPLFLIQ